MNEAFSFVKNNRRLLSILFLATILRFWQLGNNPPSLDWDETAHGYNAYSLLKTGKDEYGLPFPLYFRSFDDYKPPLYTYLTVPSIAIFGLNDFAVRLPSAFLGILAVIFTYLMVFELLKNKTVAHLSALFLAISPWHLQFSRVAFETNSAIFWSVLGTWAFLRGIKSDRGAIVLWLSLAALAFGANLFMYHNSRVFVPIFTVILVFLSRRRLLEIKQYLIVPFIIAFILSLILLPIVTSPAGQVRFKGTTIFADQSPQYLDSQLIAQDEQSGNLTSGRIFHNRRLTYVPIIIYNYLTHLRPNYLFFTADLQRHHAPQIGLLYLWDLPFILSGIYFLVKNNFARTAKIIIFSWFLIAPVASSVTWGVPHSLRSEIYLPTFQIFSALGVYFLYKVVFQKNKAFLMISAIALLANFLFYLHQYYVHMPVEYSQSWLYGRKEAALFTEKIKDNYQRVIVSTKLEQPHEFWLYYLKYDPQKYQEEGGTVSGGFREDRNKFDKYQFKPIIYEKQNREVKTLFVGIPEEFPPGVNILKKIYYLDGQEAIYIVG